MTNSHPTKVTHMKYKDGFPICLKDTNRYNKKWALTEKVDEVTCDQCLTLSKTTHLQYKDGFPICFNYSFYNKRWPLTEDAEMVTCKECLFLKGVVEHLNETVPDWTEDKESTWGEIYHLYFSSDKKPHEAVIRGRLRLRARGGQSLFSNMIPEIGNGGKL